VNKGNNSQSLRLKTAWLWRGPLSSPSHSPVAILPLPLIPPRSEPRINLIRFLDDSGPPKRWAKVLSPNLVITAQVTMQGTKIIPFESLSSWPRLEFLIRGLYCGALVSQFDPCSSFKGMWSSKGWTVVPDLETVLF
jgi:hypothetical protein